MNILTCFSLHFTWQKHDPPIYALKYVYADVITSSIVLYIKILDIRALLGTLLGTSLYLTCLEGKIHLRALRKMSNMFLDENQASVPAL